MSYYKVKDGKVVEKVEKDYKPKQDEKVLKSKIDVPLKYAVIHNEEVRHGGIETHGS